MLYIVFLLLQQSEFTAEYVDFLNTRQNKSTEDKEKKKKAVNRKIFWVSLVSCCWLCFSCCFVFTIASQTTQIRRLEAFWQASYKLSICVRYILQDALFSSIGKQIRAKTQDAAESLCRHVVRNTIVRRSFCMKKVFKRLGRVCEC